MIHHHRPVSVVDLGVDTGVADEVDNPLLAFVLVEAKAGGEVSVRDVLATLLGGFMAREGWGQERESWLT